MNPPTAIVAEDEAHLRRELCDTLAALWPELVVTGQAGDGLQACALLEARVDLAGEVPARRVRLDDREGALDGHDVSRPVGSRGL